MCSSGVSKFEHELATDNKQDSLLTGRVKELHKIERVVCLGLPDWGHRGGRAEREREQSLPEDTGAQ